MNLFFDTSALVKYFHAEAGTAQVVTLMDDSANEIWVSDLARVEFISALHRKFRRGDIDDVQLQETLAAFDLEWAQMNQQPINDAVIQQADQLMRQKAKQYDLRALDAIQLASFMLLAEDNWSFVVADGILADTVTSENLTTIRIAC